MKKYRKVKTLFENKSRWTYGFVARNKYGHGVSADSDNAVRFCLIGAVERVYSDLNIRRIVFEKIEKEINSIFISSYNDNEGYDTVKSLVNKLDI